jgi:hypothetical protein
MSSRELDEWAAFYELEPFGPARGDVRAGIIAGALGGKSADYYFPNLRERREATLEEDVAAMMRIYEAHKK